MKTTYRKIGTLPFIVYEKVTTMGKIVSKWQNSFHKFNKRYKTYHHCTWKGDPRKLNSYSWLPLINIGGQWYKVPCWFSEKRNGNMSSIRLIVTLSTTQNYKLSKFKTETLNTKTLNPFIGISTNLIGMSHNKHSYSIILLYELETRRKNLQQFTFLLKEVPIVPSNWIFVRLFFFGSCRCFIFLSLTNPLTEVYILFVKNLDLHLRRFYNSTVFCFPFTRQNSVFIRLVFITVPDHSL